MKRLTSILCTVALLFTSTWASAEGSTAPANILIAYYTWADNTIVEDADASIASALAHYASMGDDASSTDATSSASLLAPGNTAIMAGHIHDLTGGDLFSIQVEEPYPSNYDDTLDRAADELDADARPTLKTHVENMAQYDVIFLGMPNWWYSCPRAILSFIEAYDLSGKTIIPFVAHGTGGISGSVRDMSAALPADCTVLTPLGVYRPDIADCQPAIEEWLSNMDIVWSAPVSQKALRIRLTVGENAYEATSEDNSTACDLVSRLPLTVTFEDYKEGLICWERLHDVNTFRALPEGEIKSSGYVVDTLEAALWCLLKTNSYQECVLKAVNLGSDTDTVAAVAGGLAGVYYGLSGIPEAWRDGLQNKKLLDDGCDKLATFTSRHK